MFEIERELRSTKAEELLCETDLSITEVAQQCGYNDSNYFSTVFKQTHGLSPSQWQRWDAEEK